MDTATRRLPRVRLGPVAAIERTVLDSLGEMRHVQPIGAFQIGDGPGYFEDAVVGSRREPLLLHGPLQEALGVRAQFAIGANLPGGHLRIRKNLFSVSTEPLALPFPCRHYPVANLGGAFPRRSAAQLLVMDRRHLDVNVDTVEQRAGDFGYIALDHRRRAEALARLVIKPAARLRITSLLNLA